jgi:hypothetical protein
MSITSTIIRLYPTRKSGYFKYYEGEGSEMSKPLAVALSPHDYSRNSVEKLMYGVVMALIPALLMSVYVFGWSALIIWRNREDEARSQ